MGYYKLLSITDKENNIKEEVLQSYSKKYPEMEGYIHNIEVGNSLYYKWKGENTSTLVTSSVKSYTVRDDETIEVVTRNSIYHFLRIKN